jgi:hypothetical protein
MSSTDGLTAKARFMRNAAPQQYADFCSAFADYARAAADKLVMADENTQLYQGHAQQCKHILKLLEDVKNGQ